MNLRECFLSSLVSSPKHSPQNKPEDFLGQLFHECHPLCPQMPHILSSGSINATYPWSFHMNGINCHMLLYTTRGCGKLLVNHQVYTLDASSILFFDCTNRFRIDIAVEPWNYQVLFLEGELLSSYYQLLPDGQPGIIRALPHSELAMNIEALTLQKPNSGTCSRLVTSDLLNHTLTGIVTSLINKEDSTARIPDHLEKIREQFDRNYREFYSLELLAQQYHVSKYRLCREFSSAYGYPPLQYLNRHRIDVAVHLLLTTDLRVHEIGSQVGIDNTNHFISLFKKFKNYTPAEYKQRMTG